MIRDRTTIPIAERHLSVMSAEVLRWLTPKEGGRYLDGTLGLGGHSAVLLGQIERAGGRAKLVGLDRDLTALTIARQRLTSFYSHDIHLEHSTFSRFPEVLKTLGWNGLDGVLIDLGVSSLQLDSPERGFSFQANGPLDMRMDTTDASQSTTPAARLVNKASINELKNIIWNLGEDPMAGRIARAIVTARAKTPIETTEQLAAIVAMAYPPKWRATARNHPVTRTFQALRIAVNRELEELQAFLKAIPTWLKPGGRIVMLSFHSLEDRLIKCAFRAESKGCTCPQKQTLCTCSQLPRLRILTKRPVRPTDAEVAINPRARSARLRAAERLSDSLKQP